MLIAVKGDNKPLIQNFLKSKRNNYNQEDIFVIDHDEYTKGSIIDLVRSDGLFSSQRLIISEPSKVDDIDLNLEFFEEVKNNKDIEFVVILSNINGNTKIVKEIVKLAETKEFTNQRDYSSFNFIDSLFLNNDLGKTLNSIEVLDVNNDFYSIIGLLHTTLRNFISAKYNNKSFKTIHPFVKKKLVNYKLNENIVLGLYDKLIDIDVKSKTESVQKKVLLTEFVIYYFQRTDQG